MKYENTKHKIKQIFEQETSNSNQIENLSDDINLTKSNVKDANRTLQTISKDYDFSTGWTNLEIGEFEREIDYDYVAHYEWIIELPNIPIKYLPYLNVNVIYANIPIIFDLDDINSFHIIRAERIENDICIHPKLIVGLRILNVTEGVIFRAKVLVGIHNPEAFI